MIGRNIWQANIVAGIVASMISLAVVNARAQSRELTRVPQKLSITAMRANLFYENSGTFSKDVFTNEVNLWNTTIEGASREGASESMLVVVEIKMEPGAWTPSLREMKSVQLTARYRIADRSGYGKPAYFNKTLRINIGSDDKFFAGFWLYETGCHPVHLTARIIGQKHLVRKTINLRCGE